MAFSIGFGKDATLYGLLVGTVFINKVTHDKWKRWAVHFYSSKKGRKQGMIYQARQYPGSDMLTFELTLEELIKSAKLATVIPRELYVDYDISKFLREKQRE